MTMLLFSGASILAILVFNQVTKPIFFLFSNKVSIRLNHPYLSAGITPKNLMD